jgi:hypothetical protein
MSVQDDVTRTVVVTVAGRVRAEDLTRALHKTSDNLAAYDLLLHGRHCLDNWTKDGILRSRICAAAFPQTACAYDVVARLSLRSLAWRSDPVSNSGSPLFL